MTDFILGGIPTFVVSPPTSSAVILVPIRGTPGVDGSNRLYSQNPVESPDGNRVSFTLSQTYLVNTLIVYLNGLRETYVQEVNTTTFIFDTAPATTDIIKLDFNL